MQKSQNSNAFHKTCVLEQFYLDMGFPRTCWVLTLRHSVPIWLFPEEGILQWWLTVISVFRVSYCLSAKTDYFWRFLPIGLKMTVFCFFLLCAQHMVSEWYLPQTTAEYNSQSIWDILWCSYLLKIRFGWLKNLFLCSQAEIKCSFFKHGPQSEVYMHIIPILLSLPLFSHNIFSKNICNCRPHNSTTY